MGKIPKEQREEIVMHYLEIVGLSDYSRSYIHQLSGGMKQRVTIVYSSILSLNPKVLLMDEPLATRRYYNKKIFISRTFGST